MSEAYRLGSHGFRSRLIIGSGKYASFEQNRRCAEESGAEINQNLDCVWPKLVRAAERLDCVGGAAVRAKRDAEVRNRFEEIRLNCDRAPKARDRS